MIVIVIGMHRSGTSALAGLLHTNGIIMGEEENFYPKPAFENQKGFFENCRFRDTNDYILSYNNYWANNYSPMTPEKLIVTDQAEDTIRALLYEYDKKYDHWGFKDPRMCLTYSAWKPFLQKPYTDQIVKVVLVERNIDSIASSLLLRGSHGTKEQFAAVAKEYYKQIYKDIDFYDFTAIIKFEDLIKKTADTLDFLSYRLNWSITDSSFIDKELVHQ